MSHKFIPQVLPTWAEDETYPIGSDPWSGAPTKVEIISALKNVGVEPDSQMGAQHYNWLNYRYSRSVKALLHSPMQAWDTHKVSAYAEVSVSGDSYHLPASCSSGKVIASCIADFNEKAIASHPVLMVCGENGEDSSIMVSPYGSRWFEVTSPSDTELNDLCGTMPGVVWAVEFDSRDINYTLNMGETWVTSTDVAPADGSFATLLVSGDRVLAAITGTSDATANRLFVSDDVGGTWTPIAIGSTYSIVAWATNGSGTIVAYAQNSGFGGVDKLLYSTDNGDTWVVGRDAGDSFQRAAVCYSPVWNSFMVTSQEGKIWTSQDGASWVQRTGFTFIPASFNALASVGNVIAMVVDASFAVSPAFRHASGVLYSFDIGSTWYYVPLGIVSPAGSGVKTIRAHGGRFVVGSIGYVHVSGALWDPEPDVTIS